MNKIMWPIYIDGFPEDDKSLIAYSVGKDGIYCKKNVCGDGYAIFKVDNIPELEYINKPFSITIEKISHHAYFAMIDFYRYVNDTLKGCFECYILIAKKQGGKYFLYVPEQIVTGTTVRYDLSQFYNEHPNCIIVAESHLHPNFNANFSFDDDKDDCRDRYSLVIGNIQNIIPTYSIRFSTSNGRRWDLKLEDVFSKNIDNFINNLNYEKAIEKISVKKFEPEEYVPKKLKTCSYQKFFFS